MGNMAVHQSYQVWVLFTWVHLYFNDMPTLKTMIQTYVFLKRFLRNYTNYQIAKESNFMHETQRSFMFSFLSSNKNLATLLKKKQKRSWNNFCIARRSWKKSGFSRASSVPLSMKSPKITIFLLISYFIKLNIFFQKVLALSEKKFLPWEELVCTQQSS